MDWLRFVAALMVLVVHARGSSFVAFGELPVGQHGTLVRAFFGITRLGQESVILFFVLSGYLVGGRLIEKIRNDRFDLSQYVIDRITRIFVPLVPAILLTATLMAWIGRPVTIWTVLGNMVGLQGTLVPILTGNDPLWSLAYEFWFYVVAGALGALTTARGKFTSILVISIALTFLAALNSSNLIIWLIGALIYGWRPVRCPSAVTIVSLVLIGFGIIETEYAQRGVMHDSSWGFMPLNASHVLLSSGFAIILPFLMKFRTRSKIFSRLGSICSEFSYSLYLIHFPILMVINSYVSPSKSLSAYSLSAFCLRIVVCLVAALVFYSMFERHTAAVRRLLKTQILVTADGPGSGNEHAATAAAN